MGEIGEILKPRPPIEIDGSDEKMSRLKCKKCGNVFERGIGSAIIAPHVGPYHYMKCPACEKSSWFNVYSSVKNEVTYPPQEKKEALTPEPTLSDEELEKKRIEESKYEKS
jgi:hypothetical protein